MSSGSNLFLDKRISFLVLLVLVVGVFLVKWKFFGTENHHFGQNAPVASKVEMGNQLNRVLEIPVIASGTVKPARSSDVSSAIYGKVEWVNPKFHEGGVFDEGEAIIMLSKGNYEAAVAERQAELEQAKLELANEQIETMKSVRKYDSSGNKKGSESDLVLRLPNRRLASSRVEAGEAAVKAATEALSRTTVTAPYPCTVLGTKVDVGSVVKAGDVVCSIYSSYKREVHLNIPAELLGYIRSKPTGDLDIPVVVQSPAIDCYKWRGLVKYMKGALEPSSLSAVLVAQFQESKKNPDTLAFLPINLPVEARLSIRMPEPGYLVPGRALVDGGLIWVVDSSGKLASRNVQVIGTLSGNVMVSSGDILPDDILCLSIGGEPKEGMQILAPGKAKAPAPAKP